MEDKGVPAAVALRRARRSGAAWVVGLLAAEFGIAFIVRPDPHPPVLIAPVSIFAGLLAAALPVHCKATGPIRHNAAGRITAQTSTGERTIDLRRIRRVSSFRIPQWAKAPVEVLVVKDCHGVRLGLTDPDDYPFVKAALKRQARNPDIPAPRVTRRTRRILDTGRLPWWRSALSTFGTLAYGISVGAGFMAVAVVVAST